MIARMSKVFSIAHQDSYVIILIVQQKYLDLYLVKFLDKAKLFFPNKYLLFSTI